MRLLKGLVVFLFAVTMMAMAAGNKLGIRDVYHVTLDGAVHVGTTVLPAGEYVVRHTMEGEEHVMVFRRQGSKDETKVKCKLVPLGHKADQTAIAYGVDASNERVLQEMVFSGDTAKHVF